MKEREHIYYFDYLRVFAFMSVIFMHTAAMPLRAGIGGNWYVTNVVTCLAFTAVPLFFMMSGYLLMTSKKTEDALIMLKNRLPRLIVPLVFWTIMAITWLLSANHQFTIKEFLKSMISATSQPAMVHMWYMYTLIAIYIISPFLYAGLHNMKRSGHILLFSILVIVSLQYMIRIVVPEPFNRLFMWDIVDKMQFFGGHLCTFFLGYYLGTSKKKVSNKLLIILAVFSLTIISVGTWFLTIQSGEFDQTFQVQSQGYEILLASSIFLLAKQNLNKTKKWIEHLVKPLAGLSLPVYLCHNIILSILGFYGIEGSSFIKIVMVTCLTALISFLFAKTTASIKPVCFLVNGVTYKNACENLNWQYTFRWITKKES